MGRAKQDDESESYDEDAASDDDEMEEEEESPMKRKSGRPPKPKKFASDDDEEQGGANNGVSKMRRRVAEEDDDEWMKDAKKILKKIMDHPDNDKIFNSPVDAKQLKLVDYHDVIKNPMDLGTVKKSLTQHMYDGWKDFVKDVHLTFQNAMTYNPQKDGVHQLAVKLCKKFNSLWNESRKTKVLKFDKTGPRIAGEDDVDDPEDEDATRGRSKGGRRSKVKDEDDGSDCSGYLAQRKCYPTPAPLHLISSHIDGPSCFASHAAQSVA
eukprot:1075026-Rhodomonas_salina.2